MQLLQAGRTVVAALRTADKAAAAEAMSGMGIQEGVQKGGCGPGRSDAARRLPGPAELDFRPRGTDLCGADAAWENAEG